MHSAASKSLTCLAGQFWGPDSDAIPQLFVRKIILAQQVDVLPGNHRAVGHCIEKHLPARGTACHRARTLRGRFSAGTEEDLRYRKNHHQEEPQWACRAERQLKSQGDAWLWRGFSVGLYVPLLEFNRFKANSDTNGFLHSFRIVVWTRCRPRSAIISTRSRRLSL